MAIGIFAPHSQWKEKFREHSRELLPLELHPPEWQEIPIRSGEPQNLLTDRIQTQARLQLPAAHAVVLENVLVDDQAGELVLPFMPEYPALREQAEHTIETPCNSGLSPWNCYGHFLHDQVGHAGLYDSHPQTRGLPLLLNGIWSGGHERLVREAWPEALVLGSRVTLVRKLHFLIHKFTQYHAARRIICGGCSFRIPCPRPGGFIWPAPGPVAC
jgi:hypothetical protein